jgi:hypothetical protein
METDHFINIGGFGWLCKRRHADTASRVSSADHARSRFMSEGEAEMTEEGKISATSFAKWGNPERRTLFCPRCGLEETIY